VTDQRRLGSDLPSRAAALARAGVDLIQLRENRLPDRELLELARGVSRAIAGSGARLLINDRFDLALLADADGVHLKSDGLRALDVRALVRELRPGSAADFLIGRACHDASEVAAAASTGETDYVTLSPLHATGHKTALGLAGFERELERARRAAGGKALPAWLALGGASADDLPALAALAAPGESWGMAAIRLFQEPGSDEAAAALAARLVARLSSLS
jgi:thiamine-phosphate pyrophosphorylase